MRFYALICCCVLIILIPGAFVVRKKAWFSDLNVEILLDKYSNEEIDHFARFAFQYGKLRKWRKDIQFEYVELSSRKNLVLELTRDCLLALDTLVEELTLTPAEKDCNLFITFLDTMVRDRTGFGLTLIDDFSIPYPAIHSGIMEVFVGNRKGDEINSTIMHEFTHILGFHHNYPIDYQSIFNPSPRKFVETDSGGHFIASFTEYSDLDKAAIRIMYDAEVGIDPGLTKEKFYRLINKAKTETRLQ